MGKNTTKHHTPPALSGAPREVKKNIQLARKKNQRQIQTQDVSQVVFFPYKNLFGEVPKNGAK